MRADYERIASRFDENPSRTHAADPLLAERLAGAAGRRLVVLDVGCGTGTYLQAQVSACGGEAAAWLGLDPAPAMLALARHKVPQAGLAVARAEALPCASGSVDHVATTFTLQHFEDKAAALDEATRVAARDASLRLLNVVPEAMPGWWIYRFFPPTRALDAGRFWRVDRLRAEKALPPRALDEEALKEAVTYAFYNDHRVTALEADLARAQNKLKERRHGAAAPGGAGAARGRGRDAERASRPPGHPGRRSLLTVRPGVGRLGRAARGRLDHGRQPTCGRQGWLRRTASSVGFSRCRGPGPCAQAVEGWKPHPASTPATSSPATVVSVARGG